MKEQCMKRISPGKVVSILSSYGDDITIEEAEVLLDFLYELAPIALKQSLLMQKEILGKE